MSGESRFRSVRPLIDRERLVSTCSVDVLQVVQELGGGSHTVMSMRKRLFERYGYAKSAPQVELALRTAHALRYAKSEHVDEDCKWTLTQKGGQLLTEMRIAWRGLVEKVSDQIVGIAEKESFPVGRKRLRRSIAILHEALLVGGAARGVVYRGGALDEDNPFCDRCDLDRVFETIQRNEADPATARFLRLLAGLALDPTHPFGVDLIDHVEKSLVLQALDAGRDIAIAHEVVGGLDEIALILDTPIFFRLASRSRSRQARVLERALHSAIDAGLEILIPQHVERELDGVLARFGRYALDVEVAKREDNTKRLQDLVTQDPGLSAWIEELPAKHVPTLEEFSQEVRSRLARLKERAKPCPFDDDPRLRAQIESALEHELRVPGFSSPARGAAQIACDGKTMLVARRRRIAGAKPGAVFAAVYALTTDTHLSKAYRRQFRDDPHPLTLTIKDFVSLQLVCRKPVSLDELAALAGLLKHEHFSQVVSRYSYLAARRVSERLHPGYDSHLDVGITEVMANQLLQRQPDLIEHPDEAVAMIAFEVLASWIEMVEERRREEGEEHLEDVNRLCEQVSVLEAHVADLERTRQDVEAFLHGRDREGEEPAWDPDEDPTVLDLRGRLDAAERSLEQARREGASRARRWVVASSVLILGLSAAGFVGTAMAWDRLEENWGAVLGIAVTTLTVGTFLIAWAKGASSELREILRLVADKVWGLITFLSSRGQNGPSA